jgi:hypothetical protein
MPGLQLLSGDDLLRLGAAPDVTQQFDDMAVTDNGDGT